MDLQPASREPPADPKFEIATIIPWGGRKINLSSDKRHLAKLTIIIAELAPLSELQV